MNPLSQNPDNTPQQLVTFHLTRVGGSAAVNLQASALEALRDIFRQDPALATDSNLEQIWSFYLREELDPHIRKLALDICVKWGEARPKFHQRVVEILEASLSIEEWKLVSCLGSLLSHALLRGGTSTLWCKNQDFCKALLSLIGTSSEQVTALAFSIVRELGSENDLEAFRTALSELHWIDLRAIEAELPSWSNSAFRASAQIGIRKLLGEPSKHTDPLLRETALPRLLEQVGHERLAEQRILEKEELLIIAEQVNPDPFDYLSSYYGSEKNQLVCLGVEDDAAWPRAAELTVKLYEADLISHLFLAYPESLCADVTDFALTGVPSAELSQAAELHPHYTEAIEKVRIFFQRLLNSDVKILWSSSQGPHGRFGREQHYAELATDVRRSLKKGSSRILFVGDPADVSKNQNSLTSTLAEDDLFVPAISITHRTHLESRKLEGATNLLDIFNLKSDLLEFGSNLRDSLLAEVCFGNGGKTLGQLYDGIIVVSDSDNDRAPTKEPSSPPKKQLRIRDKIFV